MHAYHMVVSALLHDLLEEGEKTYVQIMVYLERVREHPTCQLWMDCFIIPTQIVQFCLKQRERVTVCCNNTALKRCYYLLPVICVT